MVSKKELENILKQEISKIELIREKDGVNVSRVFYGNHSYILKYFENKDYLREIEMYKFIKKLQIKTLNIISFGERFLLMEDLNFSPDYRLANEKDLENEDVLKYLADWYKTLHTKGKTVDLSNFYDENDVITEENIKQLKSKLEQKNLDFILNNLSNIKKLYCKLSKTIVYNDFSIENMVVGEKIVFMYDYNFLGKGYAYSDIQNVLTMLGKEQKQIFLKFYDSNFSEFEKFAYSILQPLASLCIAIKRNEFPQWATRSLEYIKSQKFKGKVNNIPNILSGIL